MEEKYLIATEVKSETYFGRGIFLFDLAFIFVYWFVMSNFEFLIYESLKLPYTVFNVAFAFFLTRKSFKNPQKRIYESIIIYFMSRKHVRYYIPDRREKNEIEFTESKE